MTAKFPAETKNFKLEFKLQIVISWM